MSQYPLSKKSFTKPLKTPLISQSFPSTVSSSLNNVFFAAGQKRATTANAVVSVGNVKKIEKSAAISCISILTIIRKLPSFHVTPKVVLTESFLRHLSAPSLSRVADIKYSINRYVVSLNHIMSRVF